MPWYIGSGRGLYAVGDTVIGYSSDNVVGGSKISLSHDAGNTWEDFFFEPGNDKHIYFDVEGDELISTIGNAGVDNLIVYNLIKE
ncbi:hypothetical protein D3C84_841620 [compost metagenome]